MYAEAKEIGLDECVSSFLIMNFKIILQPSEWDIRGEMRERQQ